jgi:hypothetical protein
LFGLGLVFVYLTLAAQYESFVGAGKAGRISVGTTVFGGMIAATSLNLIFLPLLYAVVFPAAEKPRPQTTDAHSFGSQLLFFRSPLSTIFASSHKNDCCAASNRIDSIQNLRWTEKTAARTLRETCGGQIGLYWGHSPTNRWNVPPYSRWDVPERSKATKIERSNERLKEQNARKDLCLSTQTTTCCAW